MFETILFALMIGAATSLTVGLILIRFRNGVLAVAKPRDDHLAVQASHVGDPLRLGGLAVIIGMMLGALTLIEYSHGQFTQALLLSALPVFVAGFAEDLGHRVSPLGRFLAAVMSATLAVALLNAWVPRGDLPGLDTVMAFAPVAILVTILVAAVFCHAVNLIDGMNGLASMVVIVCAAGVATVAALAGLREFTVLAALIAVATGGFMLLNWPKARLLLGDGGAYGLGHVLVWVAIAIVAVSDQVAVPAMLLILFWPFADTLHSVARRRARNQSFACPDRMHLHQKIMRALEITCLGRDRRHIANPLTTVLMVPLVAAPVATGVYFWRDPLHAWVALAGYAGLFSLSHLAITLAALRLRGRIGI